MAASAYIQNKKNQVEDIDVAQILAQLDDLYTKKLWHQLTLAVMEFVAHPFFQNGGLVEFYSNFISDFEHKLNPLSLVEIGLFVVKEMMTNPDDALAFIQSIQEKVKTDVESRVLCMVAIGDIKLKSLGAVDDVKALVEEGGELMDTIDGITSVHARYYDLCGEYNKVKGDHAGYYRNALKYLGCVNIEKMSMEEKSNRAFCIAIAALVGDGVYNFGELLCQSVLEGLKYSENIWMIDLLQAFNEGDLSKFDLLRRYWERQADLLASKDKLTSKIRLLCLMELVFRRHAHQRTIGFDTIAEAARIDISEVEFLVMKGLSLGLVKGTIDEISQSVNMTWVQPRVLDMKQVKSVKCKVSEWVGQIKHTKILMEDSISDIVMTS